MGSHFSIVPRASAQVPIVRAASSVQLSVDQVCNEVPDGQGSGVRPKHHFFPAASSVQPPIDQACVDVPAGHPFVGVAYSGQLPGDHIPTGQRFCVSSQMSSIHVASAAKVPVINDRSLLMVKLTNRCCSCRATVLRQNLKIRSLQRQVSNRISVLPETSSDTG